jgi:hypothetical protein
MFTMVLLTFYNIVLDNVVESLANRIYEKLRAVPSLEELLRNQLYI